MPRKKAQDSCPTSAGKVDAFLGADSVRLAEDDWLVPATDNRGHSAKMQFRLPPALARVVQEIVQSPKTAFRTDDDFCRFAVWLAARMIQARMEVLSPSVLMAADAVIRVVRDHEHAQMIYEAIRMASSMCDRLMADGDVQGVNSRVAYIDSVIANLSPTSRWRRKFELEWREASRKYREWIRSSARAAAEPGLDLHDLIPGDEGADED